MKSQAEMQKEHEINNPGYTGNPTAPLGRYPEKDPSYTQVPWDEFGPQEQAATLRRKIGTALFDWLEENDE